MKMNNIPLHVGIIMDGNGRWAQERGKSRSVGHKEGASTLEKLVAHAKKIGVKYLSVYAFSTDNFKRSSSEVNFLMDLLVVYFNNKLSKLAKEGVKVLISGRKDNLRDDVLNAIDSITEITKDNDKLVFNICFNYGGQEEIVDATLKIANEIVNNRLVKEELDKNMFYKYLYNELPPIDLLIRTGKEHRLSNFMLYQSSYAEIYFVDTFFPDFLEKEFDLALDYYNKCDRRFGSIKPIEK